jgi:type I restriction enzyme M protein
VDQAVKSISDIMRRGNCAGAMQYVPELTWILFLRILDEKEQLEEKNAEALEALRSVRAWLRLTRPGSRCPRSPSQMVVSRLTRRGNRLSCPS